MFESFDDMIKNNPIRALEYLVAMEETITSGQNIADTQAKELGFSVALTRPLTNGEQIILAEQVQQSVKRSMGKLFSPIICEKSLLLTAPLLMRHYIPKTNTDDLADDESPVDERYHAMAIEAALIVAMCLEEIEKVNNPSKGPKPGSIDDMLFQVLSELTKIDEDDE